MSTLSAPSNFCLECIVLYDCIADQCVFIKLMGKNQIRRYEASELSSSIVVATLGTQFNVLVGKSADHELVSRDPRPLIKVQIS